MKTAVFPAGQWANVSRQGRQRSQARSPNWQRWTILSTPGGRGAEGASAPEAVWRWMAASQPAASAQRRARLPLIALTRAGG